LVAVTGTPLAARDRDEKEGNKFDEIGSLRKAIRRAEFQKQDGKEKRNHSRRIGEHG
jgi:hypothetical protein